MEYYGGVITLIRGQIEHCAAVKFSEKDNDDTNSSDYESIGIQ